MRIAIGADHAGFTLKEHLIALLRDLGHDVVDFGTQSTEPTDYPPICAAGSGQGEQMVANKIAGVRAALCNDLYSAHYSRAHNDANVMGIGARVVGEGYADEIVTTWLTTAFDGGRHQRRVDQIGDIERDR